MEYLNLLMALGFIIAAILLYRWIASGGGIGDIISDAGKWIGHIIGGGGTVTPQKPPTPEEHHGTKCTGDGCVCIAPPFPQGCTKPNPSGGWVCPPCANNPHSTTH